MADTVEKDSRIVALEREVELLTDSLRKEASKSAQVEATFARMEAEVEDGRSDLMALIKGKDAEIQRIRGEVSSLRQEPPSERGGTD